MKKTILAIIAIILVIVVIVFIVKNPVKPSDVTPTPTPTDTTGAMSTSTATTTVANGTAVSIGSSAGGLPINAYSYGNGATKLLFVGGIHGGYEWNTVLVARQLMDYLKANPSAVPANVTVTVIPVLNPDGLQKVVGSADRNFTASDIPSSQSTVVAGRYNADTVDLNRNFDCDWQATGVWQSTTVSGGSSAFSEPESQAMKNYVTTNTPAAVVVWYSAAGGVYASNCHNGVLTETSALLKTFANASGYPAHASFDFYATTGDMTNWLAKINVPAISILLTNHTDTEWSKNLSGIKAVLASYSK